MVCFTGLSEKPSLETVWKRAGTFKKILGKWLDEPSVNQTLAEASREKSENIFSIEKSLQWSSLLFFQRRNTLQFKPLQEPPSLFRLVCALACQTQTHYLKPDEMDFRVISWHCENPAAVQGNSPTTGKGKRMQCIASRAVGEGTYYNRLNHGYIILICIYLYDNNKTDSCQLPFSRHLDSSPHQSSPVLNDLDTDNCLPMA